jgi:hypothetical protein
MINFSFILLVLTFSINLAAQETNVINIELSEEALGGNRFIKIGEIAGFEYHTIAYSHKHHVYYYLPRSFKNDGKSPAMILLHGGGASTSTYDSANRVARDYMRDMISLAENLGMPVIAPTSSIGWNYPTTPFLNEVVRMINADLKVDANRIFLFGHSMGGMGITREAGLMTDLFSGFMPTAAGMQEQYQTAAQLQTYFNTRFIHINGENDHFSVFKERALQVENKMKSLESIIGMTSGYNLYFHAGGHNYNLNLVEKKIREDIFPHKRNIYQSKIFPTFGRLYVDGRNDVMTPNVDFSYSSYFWLQADLKDLKKYYLIHGEATCLNNQYTVNIEDQGSLNGLKILISSKMVNLSKPITVMINGKILFNDYISASKKRTLEIISAKADESYIFDNYIDIKL